MTSFTRAAVRSSAFPLLGVMPRPEHEEKIAEEVEVLFARLGAEEDVWTRGELRREIMTKLAAAPALRDNFAEALAAHPEI